MSEHDVPLGLGDSSESGVSPAASRLFYSVNTYQFEAVRTRSATYRPDLLSLNWLEHVLSNTAQLGRDARRLKKAAFGGVEDTDRPGGSVGFAHASRCGLDRLSPHTLHSMLGLINEIGEMAEMIHAVLLGEREFDLVNWKEEKGDAAWFLFCDCDAIGVSASEILRANIAKLAARYPDKFDPTKLDDAGRDKAAENRALEGRTDFRDGEDDPAENAT